MCVCATGRYAGTSLINDRSETAIDLGKSDECYWERRAAIAIPDPWPRQRLERDIEVGRGSGGWTLILLVYLIVIGVGFYLLAPGVMMVGSK